MATIVKRALSDLPITDIKAELEKRNLDKTGIKTALIDRLKKALVDEGKDPNTFHFDVMEASHNASSLQRLDGDVEDDVANVNGKKVGGGNATNTDQGHIRSVPQAGAKDGRVAEQGTSLSADGSDGHGQDNGDEFDLEGHPGNGESSSQESAGSQSLPKSSPTAKSGTGFLKPTTPAKGKKNQSSIVREGGDESFVLQEDDTVLNDIDADLLDGAQGEGKVPDAATALQGEAGDNKGVSKSEHGSSTTTDASAKLVENTDTKDGSKTSGSKDEKDTKTVAKSSEALANDEKSAQSGRNLWVSGLSSSTRATDLKTLFSKHGKVIAAKVVTNARARGSRCFGLVTMSSSDDATKSIQNVHRTELHGRMISVERAKTETQGTQSKVLPPSALKSPTKPSTRPQRQPRPPRPPRQPRRPETKALVPAKDDEKDQDAKPSEEKPVLPADKKTSDVVSFSKIKADQENERLRRREMFLEREKYKQRMIEQKQREEAFKIERERRRLRKMREELERQHIETERLRLQTERLQMEREQEKYRREQQRVLQERRAIKRRGPRAEEWPNKRPVSERFHGGERFEERPVHAEREQREFNRRADEPRVFREERPQREARPVRDERHPREAVRGPQRHESRSEWKSEREVNRGSGAGSGAWSNQVDRSKMDDGWDTGDMGQGDGWDNDGVMSQQSGNFSMQQGQMMGAGSVFIAPPAMQGPSGMMQGRQNDGRFGMAAASVRRF